jgi:hypothetical protein
LSADYHPHRFAERVVLQRAQVNSAVVLTRDARSPCREVSQRGVDIERSIWMAREKHGLPGVLIWLGEWEM